MIYEYFWNFVFLFGKLMFLDSHADYYIWQCRFSLEKRMNNEQTELSSSNQLSMGQLDSFGSIRDHQGPSGSIRIHQDPSGSIRDLFNPFYVCSLRPVTTSMKPVHLVAAISVDSTAPLIRTGGMLSGQSEAQSDKHQYTSSTNPQSIDNILSSTIINWQKSIIIHSSWTHSRSQLDETCTNLVLVGELRSFEPIICCMWPVAQQDFVTGCERCVATKIVTLSDTTPGKCNVLQDTNTALLWLEVEELIQAKGCQGHPGSIRQQSLYGTPCCLALPWRAVLLDVLQSKPGEKIAFNVDRPKAH